MSEKCFDISKIRERMKKMTFEEAQTLVVQLLQEDINNQEETTLLYYELALLAYQLDKDKEALSYINRVLSQADDHEIYLAFRAELHRRLHNYEASIKDYDTIITESNRRQWYPILKKANVYEEAMYFTEAAESYEELAFFKNDEFEINHFFLGRLYEKAQDYERALDHFDLYMASIDEDDDEKLYAMYIYRGVFFANQGKIKEAIMDYKEAIDIEPDNPHAYNNLGCIYKDKGNYGKAFKYFEKALDIEGEDLIIYGNVIECAIAMQDTECAWNYIDTLELSIEPGTRMYLAKASWLEKLKDYEGAVIAYHQALNYEDAEPDSINLALAKLYEKIGRYKQAIHCYEKRLKKAPQYGDDCRKIGHLYYKMANYDKALEWYERQKKKTRSHDSLSQLMDDILKAEAYFGKHLINQAKKIYSEVLQELGTLNDKSPMELMIAGQCRLGLDQVKEAIQLFDQVLLLNAFEEGMGYDAYDAHIGLAKAYEKLENYDKALISYEKALELYPEDEFTKEAKKRIEKDGYGFRTRR